MKLNKNLKMKTKLIISFLVIDAIVLFLLYTGYSTAATIIYVADPEHYLTSYAYFTMVIFAPGITPISRKCCLNAPCPPTVRTVADCPIFNSFKYILNRLYQNNTVIGLDTPFTVLWYGVVFDIDGINFNREFDETG